MTTGIECVLNAKALLGESPVWSARESALYWVDIRGSAIHRLDPATGATATWDGGENVGSLGLRQSGGAVLALRSGFATLSFETGRIERLSNPIAGRADLRFNDGRVDRRGRFWSGTVNEKRVPGTAALYRLDPDGRVSCVLDGITVANTIAWSPDDRTMYLGCSWEGVVWAFDFEIETGTVSNRRVFVRFAEDDGAPDGATADRDGGIWIAHHDGWRITRFLPDGSVDQVIDMPVARPTSVSFGGSELDELYVTSASAGLSEADLQKGPLSGSVFRLRPGQRGLPEPLFGG